MAGKILYPKREAERMLVAFEGQIAGLREYETETDYTVGSISSDRYAKFRSKSGEIYTLGIIVRTRLNNLESGPDAALTERFDRALVAAQQTMIQASLKFMEVLSKLALLPMGAREIFTGELRSLYDARERLRDPRLAPYIDADLGRKIDTAEAVLQVIIDKAPQLLSFGEG